MTDSFTAEYSSCSVCAVVPPCGNHTDSAAGHTPSSQAASTPALIPEDGGSARVPSALSVLPQKCPLSSDPPARLTVSPWTTATAPPCQPSSLLPLCHLCTNAPQPLCEAALLWVEGNSLGSRLWVLSPAGLPCSPFRGKLFPLMPLLARKTRFRPQDQRLNSSALGGACAEVCQFPVPSPLITALPPLRLDCPGAARVHTGCSSDAPGSSLSGPG